MTSCTSVVAVRTNSCVILASEGRIGTTGYGRVTSYTTSKSSVVQRRVGMGFSGDIALQRIVIGRVHEEYAAKKAYPDEVAKLVSELTRDFVLDTDTMNSVIVAGAGKDGSYQMFVIETKERSKQRKMCKEVSYREIKEKYIAVGSGSKLIDKFLMQKNVHAMSVEQAIELVMSAIKYAIGKDWGSGGRLKAVLITSKATEFKVYRESQEEYSYYMMDYSRKSCMEDPMEDPIEDSM